MQIKDLIPWARKDHVPDAKSADDHPVTALQREMNRVFESFWSRFGQGVSALDWPWAEVAVDWLRAAGSGGLAAAERIWAACQG